MSEDIEGVSEVEVEEERPEIEFRADAIHETVTAAEDVLIATKAPIFQRGLWLVMPISIEVAASDNRKTQSPSLKRVDVPVLRDHLARWQCLRSTMDGGGADWLRLPHQERLAIYS